MFIFPEENLPKAKVLHSEILEFEKKKENVVTIVWFLVAPPLPSGATYLVTMVSVCMYVCSLVEIFFTKGFFFDTGFGLIHVQTGKKFSQGTPPPPPVKGKILTPDLA